VAAVPEVEPLVLLRVAPGKRERGCAAADDDRVIHSPRRLRRGTTAASYVLPLGAALLRILEKIESGLAHEKIGR
jgi:hypothetical protein